MKKINILKKSYDFERIIKNNKPFKYRDYIVYIEKDTNDNYKFGISVGKKIGRAVKRNKIKRQIKSIIDKYIYENNFNCIIIVGREITKRTFQEMEKDIDYIFNKLNIIKEKK